MRKYLVLLIFVLLFVTVSCGGEDSSGSTDCVGEVWAGDFTLTTQDDVAEIAKYSEVTGNFSVKDSDFVNVHLLKLCKVGGDVVFDNNDNLADFSAKELLSIGGNIHFNKDISTPLVTVNLSKLKNVGGSIEISYMPSSFVVDLQKIVSIGGDFVVENNDFFDFFALPVLENVGGRFVISGNHNMSSFDVSNLVTIGDVLYIRSNNILQSVNFPMLRTVSSINVASNNALTSFDSGKLKDVGTDILFNENILFESLNFSGLESVGSHFRISNCPALQNFNLPELKTIGGNFSVYSNENLSSFSASSLLNVGGLFIGMSVYEEGNASLISFDLHSLYRVNEDFNFKYNILLPTSSIESLRDLVLNRDGIGGEVVILGNKS